jgi:SOS response regulatory protein OraA/RecX
MKKSDIVAILKKHDIPATEVTIEIVGSMLFEKAVWQGGAILQREIVPEINKHPQLLHMLKDVDAITFRAGKKSLTIGKDRHNINAQILIDIKEQIKKLFEVKYINDTEYKPPKGTSPKNNYLKAITKHIEQLKNLKIPEHTIAMILGFKDDESFQKALRRSRTKSEKK